jgi:D-lactate dehydrogenase
MNIAFYSTHKFELPYYQNSTDVNFTFLEVGLNPQTVDLAHGHDGVCAFANDLLNEEVLRKLHSFNISLIALRSAGYNHVDMKMADELGLTVLRVPEYSPYAIAEHTVALILTLNRKIHRAYNRVRESNFSLDGLTGFDLHEKTVGVIGTGKIGKVFCRIMLGFGAHVLAYDLEQDQELIERGVKYVTLEEVIKLGDVISLHVPLTPETFHLINAKTISQMKNGVMLVNTSRGGLVETKALINALKSGHVKHAALDVYEEEEGLFFHDHSESIIQDDQISRLLSFSNVLITSHQAFLTKEALENIAKTTFENIGDYKHKRKLKNQVSS